MKKILWVSVIVAVLLACNKSQDNVVPANDQKLLGLVLQTLAQSSSDNLILLKDGRIINPVSGFNPTNLQVGDKFKLAFTPVAGAASSSKVINVNVTNYVTANDSSFVPAPINTDSVTDTVAVRSFLQTKLTGTFTLSYDISTVLPVVKDVILDCNGNGYLATYAGDNSYGGSGIFFFDRQKYLRVNFVDAQISPGTDPNLILNGQYYYVLFDTNLTLCKFDPFSSYNLKK